MNKYIGKRVKGVKYQVHRIIMEKFLGRKLNRFEVVHHKDGDKSNNIINNLELMSLSKHSKIHSIGRTMSKSAIEKLRINSQKHRTQAKLTPTNVKKIRKLLKEKMLEKDIAKLHSVHISTISKINKKTTWSWV